MAHKDKTAEDMFAQVLSTFGASSKPKKRGVPKGFKQHRCLGCGKVTKHVFCESCYKARR